MESSRCICVIGHPLQSYQRIASVNLMVAVVTELGITYISMKNSTLDNK